MAHDLVTELLQYSSLACFMPIWQLCANLLIPNCLRSNLSYSPLAALELYVKSIKTQFYNLDAIISVGYRVNSINATAFRRWATRVLKNYLLKGYSVNQQLLAMQRQFDSRLEEHSLRMTRIEDKQAAQQEQLDFFIRTSTPPAEMVFFEGDFYTARVALENLVSSANHRVIVIDAYVSALTLDFLKIRKS